MKQDFKTNDHNRFICELQVPLWQIFQWTTGAESTDECLGEK